MAGLWITNNETARMRLHPNQMDGTKNLYFLLILPSSALSLSNHNE